MTFSKKASSGYPLLGRGKLLKKQKVTPYKRGNPLLTINSIVSEGGSELDWFHNNDIKYFYNNSMIFRYEFINKELPVRVDLLYETLVTQLEDYLRVTVKSTRVSSVKLKMVVKMFVKNLSRCKHHKTYSITYLRDAKYWKEFKNLSNPYFLHLIDVLQRQGYIKNFTGFKSRHGNVKSLLLIHSDLMDMITGDSEPEYDKIRQPKPELVVIKDAKKDVRKPTKKEKITVNKLTQMLENYNESLEARTISVNGVEIPEIFFRRVFNEDLNNGGRFYDSGDGVQRKSKEDRRTVTIDGETTVSLDFKSLHPNMAAELLGVKLEQDPYEPPELKKLLKVTTEETLYADPLRNLCKKALLIMINSRDTLQASRGLANAIKSDKACDEDDQEFYGILGKIPVAKVIKIITDHNSNISEYLCSRKGTYLQFLESEIMEYCIERHLEVDEVLIPVHDCCIVRKGIQTFTVAKMTEAYGVILGGTKNCKIEVE